MKMRWLAVIVMIVIFILLVNTLAVSGQEDSSNSAKISGDIKGNPCYAGAGGTGAGGKDLIYRLEHLSRNTCIDERTVGEYACSWENGVWELRSTQSCEGDSWSCEEIGGGGAGCTQKVPLFEDDACENTDDVLFAETPDDVLAFVEDGKIPISSLPIIMRQFDSNPLATDFGIAKYNSDNSNPLTEDDSGGDFYENFITNHNQDRDSVLNLVHGLRETDPYTYNKVTYNEFMESMDRVDYTRDFYNMIINNLDVSKYRFRDEAQLTSFLSDSIMSPTLLRAVADSNIQTRNEEFDRIYDSLPFQTENNPSTWRETVAQQVAYDYSNTDFSLLIAKEEYESPFASEMTDEEILLTAIINIPGVGEGDMALHAADEFSQGNYGMGTLYTGFTLLSAVPFFKSGMRAVTRGINAGARAGVQTERGLLQKARDFLRRNKPVVEEVGVGSLSHQRSFYNLQLKSAKKKWPDIPEYMFKLDKRGWVVVNLNARDPSVARFREGFRHIDPPFTTNPEYYLKALKIRENYPKANLFELVKQLEINKGDGAKVVIRLDLDVTPTRCYEGIRTSEGTMTPMEVRAAVKEAHDTARKTAKNSLGEGVYNDVVAKLNKVKRDTGVQEEVDYLVASKLRGNEIHATRINQPIVVGGDGNLYFVSPVYKPRLTEQQIREQAAINILETLKK